MSKIKIVDTSLLTGYPEFILRDRDGNVIKQWKDKNQVVAKGRAGIVKIIGGSELTYTKITKCSIGEGGCDPGTPFTPIVIADNRIGMLLPLPTPDDDPENYPHIGHLIQDFGNVPVYDDADEPTQVTFSTTFLAEDINDLVNEVGIWFSDGLRVYAIYHFPTISLSTTYGYSLEVRWVVKFTA